MLIASAAVSMFAALMGAEGVTLVGAGVILGLVLGHVAAGVLGSWIARTNAWSITGFAWQPAEGRIALAVLAAGAATCLIPAFQAYRRDPAIPEEMSRDARRQWR